MTPRSLLYAVIALLHPGLGLAGGPPIERASFAPLADQRVEHFAFGSCNKQGHRNRFWPQLLASDATFFLWLGDNIYGDTTSPRKLRERYARQLEDPNYREVLAALPVDGVWDDHDFGTNNSGADHPIRAESQRAFLDFLGVPATSPRRERAGTYHDLLLGPPGEQVHFVFLDTRYHRTPAGSEGATLLGGPQWEWLTSTLEGSPASLVFLVSSISILSPEHRFLEEWAPYDADYQRLSSLVERLPAARLFILTGDRHFAGVLHGELGGRPVIELMSSGLTHAVLPFFKPFYRRIHGKEQRFFRKNYAQVRVDWSRPEQPRVRFEAIDRKGRTRVLAEL